MQSTDTPAGYLTATQHAFTVAQFCDAHHIGRTHFYALIKQGLGPKIIRLGKRTIVSAEAAADWRRQMEAATANATLEADVVGSEL